MNHYQTEQSLHDKATRGMALSAEEQSRLSHWYDVQDRAESGSLATPSAAPPHDTLKSKVDAAVAELLIVTQGIQALTKENDALRREIAILYEQLTGRTMVPAV